MIDKLRDAAGLLRDHFWLLCGITIVTMLPFNLALNYLIFLADSYLESTVFSVLTLLLYIGLHTLCLAALAQALGRIMLSDHISLAKALEHGVQKWPQLFWTWLVANFFILLGLICFILPGIYLAIKYLFVPFVAVLEDVTGHECRKRSWHLSDGRGAALVGTYLLLAAPVLALEVVLATVTADSFSSAPLLRSLFDLAQDLILLWPFTAVFLHFWEARAQEEKLEHLTQDLLKLEHDVRFNQPFAEQQA
jgi:hypothetical protein